MNWVARNWRTIIAVNVAAGVFVYYLAACYATWQCKRDIDTPELKVHYTSCVPVNSSFGAIRRYNTAPTVLASP